MDDAPLHSSVLTTEKQWSEVEDKLRSLRSTLEGRSQQPKDTTVSAQLLRLDPMGASRHKDKAQLLKVGAHGECEAQP